MEPEGEGEEEEPEPEPELPPEEQVKILKEKLANGDMGPHKFDELFQPLHQQCLENKDALKGTGSAPRPSLRRGATKSNLSTNDVNLD